jgi:hypothetical protein
LKRTPLKRGKPVNRVNRKRRVARSKAAFGDKAAWIRMEPCAVFEHGRGLNDCNHMAKREAAHVKSRGAGGTSTHMIPLCNLHHAEQHAVGIQTFATKYGLDLEALAAEYERRWQTEIA